MDNLYTATKNGFKFQNYISRVLNKKNLLTIIKSQHDKVFGGFYSIPRTLSNNFTPDNQAFIFSLTHKSQHL